MTKYAVQKDDTVREATPGEWTRAVLVGQRVKIDNEGAYGYLYRGELYVKEELK